MLPLATPLPLDLESRIFDWPIEPTKDAIDLLITWPLASLMVCIIYFNRFRPGSGEGLALVFDWFVLFDALYATKVACERLLRRRRHVNL